MSGISQHRRKIIHVVPTLGTGGTERNALRIIRSFSGSRNTDNVVVSICNGDGGMAASFESVTGAKVIAMPNGRLQRLVAFYRLIRVAKPSALVFHFFNLEQASLLAVARAAVRCQALAAAGTSPVGASFIGQHKWRSAIVANRLLGSPIISASFWISETLGQLSKLPKGSKVVHNGIDVARYQSANRSKPIAGPRSKRWVLGMVARLEGAKDHVTLIRALALFTREHHDVDVVLKLIGDGPLRSKLEELVSELSLRDRVLFLGVRSDIPEQLASLDAFVFSTTEKEGFGNAVIEALAAGLPVIANDVPSSREVLRGGEFGLLVPSQTPNAWLDSLNSAWEGRALKLSPTAHRLDRYYGVRAFSDGYWETLFPSPGSGEV